MRMLNYSNTLAKRNPPDPLEGIRPKSQAHIARPISSYCLEVKRQQADYLKKVEQDDRMIKKIFHTRE